MFLQQVVLSQLTLNLQGLNLYLIGMMGCGKSTVGQLLSPKLQYRFFDTDTIITQSTGCTIAEIFAESGEAIFRQIETQVLSELSAYTRLVVATGGGIVLERMNWSHLQQGLVVWLDAPIETLLQRLQGDATRPLLQTDNPHQKLQQLLDQRQSLYAQADLRIQIQAQETSLQVCDRILAQIPAVLRSQETDTLNSDSIS